jgi:hypothetical protein
MHKPTMRHRLHTHAATLACILAAACGGAHFHLNEYTFAGRSLALVVLGNPAPGLITPDYDVRSTDLIDVAVKAGSKVAKDVEARRAGARMDSATARMDLTDSLATRTLDRASRYLGVRPIGSSADADFLLEVRMRNYGLDARGTGAAWLYTNAEAVLLDRRTGREIWNVNVHGSDRLAPRIGGAGETAGAIIAAGALHSMTVEDFQQALDQLMSLSSNVVTDQLRVALRDARR